MPISRKRTVALAGLLVWQQARERQMSRCRDDGGIWNGRGSVCAPAPPGPIIRRDLLRT